MKYLLVLFNRAIPPELRGVSVKNMVKVLGESKINGNSSSLLSEYAQPTRSLSAHTPRGIEASRSVSNDSGLSKTLSTNGMMKLKHFNEWLLSGRHFGS